MCYEAPLCRDAFPAESYSYSNEYDEFNSGSPVSLCACLEGKVYHCVNSSLCIANFLVCFSSVSFSKNSGHPQLTSSIAIAIRGLRWN